MSSLLRGPGGWLQNGLRGQGAERVDAADGHFSRAALEADRVRGMGPVPGPMLR